jgi:hypothetical protein
VRRLQAPLHLLLTPLAEELMRLGQEQREVLALQQAAVERLLARPLPVSPVQAELHHREVTSLLLELLQETQPSAEEQLLQVTASMPLSSSPSSES